MSHLRLPYLCLMAALALLQGCVFVPRTVEIYDPECQLLARQMVLESSVVLNTLHHCGGDMCAAVLVGAGVVTAASLVVSGSIAIIGNVVYWFESRGRCAGRPAADPAVNPAGRSPPAMLQPAVRP